MALVTQGGAFIVTQAGQNLMPIVTLPPLAWPTATMMPSLRQRVGLLPADATKDAEITAAFKAALAFVESYLDRKLLLATETEQFVPHGNMSVSLRRYPIIQVQEVVSSFGYAWADGSWRLVNKENGVLYLGPWNGEVMVTYDGGYDEATMPADLMLAILLVFDQVWGQMTTVGGGGATAGQTIKSITSAGATVSYFDPNASSGGGASDASGLPLGAVGLLSSYRRALC